MLLSIYLHEDIINEKYISVALVLLLQTTNIFQTELVTPQTNCLVANGDPTFSQQVFDISMAEIESMIEPNGRLNDFRRKSVTLVQCGWSFHPTITLYRQLTCQYPLDCSDKHFCGRIVFILVVVQRWLRFC